MDPKFLAALLKYYRGAASRAGVTFRCLEDDDDNGLVVEQDGDTFVARIQGPMDGGWFGFSAAELITAMDEAKPSSIRLLIESPGGFVDEGMALYTDLRARAGEGVAVRAESRGLVASAAVLPFLAADDRAMGEGAMLMIHNVWGLVIAIGDADEITKATGKTIRALEALTANFRATIEDRTTLAAAAVRTAMDEETWYNSDEAIAAGFADSALAGDDGDAEASATARRALLAWRTQHARRAINATT